MAGSLRRERAVNNHPRKSVTLSPLLAAFAGVESVTALYKGSGFFALSRRRPRVRVPSLAPFFQWLNSDPEELARIKQAPAQTKRPPIGRPFLFQSKRYRLADQRDVRTGNNDRLARLRDMSGLGEIRT
jgi:hypothetical protein